MALLCQEWKIELCELKFNTFPAYGLGFVCRKQCRFISPRGRFEGALLKDYSLTPYGEKHSLGAYFWIRRP